MSPLLATALAWLLTAAVVAGAAYLAWMLLKKLGVTAEHHLAQLGERLRAWAATPFVGAGTAGRAAGRAGQQAWTARANRPDPAPSPATVARQQRWGQTRPGRAAVRVERGAAHTGRAVGRWTGAGTAAVGSGVRAFPQGWTEGVEHVRNHRRRRTEGGPGTDQPGQTATIIDPAQPAKGPDPTGTDPTQGPAKGPAKGPDAGDDTKGPAKGPDADGTKGPAKGPDADGTQGPGDGEPGDPTGTGPAKEPIVGGDPAAGAENGTTERTGQAGAPDTKETDMAEITEFTNTGDLRAEVEELETTAEELAEQVAEFHRRRGLIEEKLGAAPFGTRAIAEAAASVSDAKTLEEAQEALAELRRAVDESDAVADVSESLEAKGDVEAFATA